tara:strand:+ start:348 stop:584 length:237 start_codon:yes stop_codon:yes gene_type:complete
MKSGDLVKYVGSAPFYKGRIGVVCSLRDDNVLVYYAGAEQLERAYLGVMPQSYGKAGLHPMGLSELEVIYQRQLVPII